MRNQSHLEHYAQTIKPKCTPYIGRLNGSSIQTSLTARHIYLLIQQSVFLNYQNKNKRNAEVSPHCSHCPNIKETASHFLGECQAYSETRFNIFGQTEMSTEEIIANNKPQKIMKYVRGTGRLKTYELQR